MDQNDRHIFELWQIEQNNLVETKQQQPEFFRRPFQYENADMLGTLGIILPEKELPVGYLKFHPFDFIVEEIQKDSSIIGADFTEISVPEGIQAGQTVYADLVKVGISTFDAIRDLARQLNIPETQIAYAGIKDAIALTSQRISIRGVTNENFINFQQANYILKNIHVGKGAVEKGGLLGNRFTIFLRTEQPVDAEWLQSRVDMLAEQGFWNFYWLQRFGNRLMGHKLGAGILRGNYREVVRSYLCDEGLNDPPFFRNVRLLLTKNFGNWKAMKKVIEPLPYSMRNELLLMNHLENNGKDYVGALQQIPEQAVIWVMAYTSYLTNRKISEYVASGQRPPEELPMPLSTNASERALYEEFMEEERIPKHFEPFLKPFGHHFRLAVRYVHTKIVPGIHFVQPVEHGIVLCFDLPKGTYATTFLSHIFTLTGGQPVPAWVNRDLYDTKQVIGLGSLEKPYEVFKDFIAEKTLVDSE